MSCTSEVRRVNTSGPYHSHRTPYNTNYTPAQSFLRAHLAAFQYSSNGCNQADFARVLAAHALGCLGRLYPELYGLRALSVCGPYLRIASLIYFEIVGGALLGLYDCHLGQGRSGKYCVRYLPALPVRDWVICLEHGSFSLIEVSTKYYSLCNQSTAHTTQKAGTGTNFYICARHSHSLWYT